jgi:hypothetical protein
MPGFNSSKTIAPRGSVRRSKRKQQWLGSSASTRQLLLEQLEERCVLSNYQYTILDVPGSRATVALGINDSGQIVGRYYDAALTEHGFLLDQGNYTTLDLPGSAYTEAQGINDSGQIVGAYTDAANNRWCPRNVAELR